MFISHLASHEKAERCRRLRWIRMRMPFGGMQGRHIPCIRVSALFEEGEDFLCVLRIDLVSIAPLDSDEEGRIQTFLLSRRKDTPRRLRCEGRYRRWCWWRRLCLYPHN